MVGSLRHRWQTSEGTISKLLLCNLWLRIVFYVSYSTCKNHVDADYSFVAGHVDMY